jgi:hypothetical protein
MPGVFGAKMQRAESITAGGLPQAVGSIGVELAVKFEVVVHAPAKLKGNAEVALVEQVTKMRLEGESNVPPAFGLGQIDREQAG